MRKAEKKDELRDDKTACMLGFFYYESDARVQNYVEFLTKNGYSVDVICPGKKSYRLNSKNGPLVSVYAVGNKDGKNRSKVMYLWRLLIFFVLAMVKINRLYLKEKYKIIHIHNVPDFLVFTSILPKLLGAKIILDIHDILPEFYGRKFQIGMNNWTTKALLHLEKGCCKFADHVIVANDIWREKLIKRSTQPDKCTSLINFANLELFCNHKAFHDKKGDKCFRIIYHGAYTEHHGVDIAIKAIHILQKKIKNCKFLLYGSGPYRNKIVSIIHDLSLDQIIEMREEVPLLQVPLILKDADIGVVPKKDGPFVEEALSTKLFQYVAMGIPTVVSRTIAEQRFFDEGEVKYFTPNDSEDMARKIWEYYENPGDRFAVAQMALHRMEKDQYSMEASEKIYMGLINSLCKMESNGKV